MPLRSRPLRFLAVTVGAVLTAAVSAGAVPGGSVSVGAVAAPPAATTGTGRAAGAGTVARTITLLSGDRVTVERGADGGLEVREITPRPGGAPVTFQTLRNGNELYVVPSDATGLIADGRLDMGAFDVGYLVTHGYADAAMGDLPLILQYAPTAGRSDLAAKADVLPATDPTHTLESVRATAVEVDKARISDFWSRITKRPESLTGIWLDQKVRMQLDRSVPQIGAPAAWAAGLDGSGVRVAVLDTGVDEAHPDLAGRIELTHNFTADPSAADGNGHGTHVASTLAGSGAASDGRYRGVAPGASLLIGKVLDAFGHGTDSMVIDGMEWAAANQADIVNMSLGGDPTDGSDPLSQAVDSLSAQYGTLFVVAAGNAGPHAQTIASPGSADSALTVAAVDDSDQMATFSSRGPRLGDRGLKPDIAAPGVDIVAARAAGTSEGKPVDDLYSSMSGTSMATPHVAGAAALLAQQHPDWTAAQLKATLMSTAADVGHSAYDQGAGRVDVARAVEQGVQASGSIDFGAVDPQVGAGAITRTVTYSNTTDEPVTVNSTASLRAYTGDPAPRGMITLGQESVAVPAHGSADLSVRVDPSQAGGAGAYQGAVRATGAGVRLTTSVGVYIKPPTARVTVTTSFPEGATQTTVGRPLLVRMDGRQDLDDGPIFVPTGADSVTVAKGPYVVAGSTTWRDPSGERNYAVPVASEVDVSEDRTVTFDLATAKRVRVETPRPTESYDAWMAFQRIDAAQSWIVEGTAQGVYGAHNYWALPTGEATHGSFQFLNQHLLGAPLIRMTASGPPGQLHPAYQSVDPAYPKLDGHRDIPLAFAGRGLPADFADVDVRGKLVLLALDDICAATCSATALDRVTNAANAGAVGVLGFGTVGRPFLRADRSWPTYPIPALGLPADEGQALVKRLAGDRTVSIQTDAMTQSPYVYALEFHDNRIRGNPSHEVDADDLYRIDNEVYADQASRATASWKAYRSGDLSSPGNPLRLTSTVPRSMVEYVGPRDPSVLWHRHYEYDYGPELSSYDVFDRPGNRTEEWGKQPLAAGTISVPRNVTELGRSVPRVGGDTTFCGACRTGDTFTPMVSLTDGDRHVGEFAWFRSPTVAGGSTIYEQRLERAGAEVPLEIGRFFLGCAIICIDIPIPTFPMSPDESAYQLDIGYSNLYPDATYARDADSTWTFTSSRPTGTGAPGYLCWGHLLLGGDSNSPCRPERLLYLGYDMDVDLDNAVPAGQPRSLTITGYHNAHVDPEPPLASVEVEVSFDDGATWRSVPTTPSSERSYSATITSPPLSQTSGAVSLRVRATDDEGNTIEQTISRAYGLESAGGF